MKKLFFISSLLIILILTNTYASHAIPVDFSSATTVTGPYPYSHDDTFYGVNEIDYYKLWLNAGEAFTADIDNGFDGRDDGFITPGEDVDTILTLFYNSEAGFKPYGTFGSNCYGIPNADDAGCAIDAGSYPANPFVIPGYTKDPYISYAVADTGYYYLAVTVTDNYYVSGEFTGVSNPNSDVYQFDTNGRLGIYTLVLNVTPVPEPSTWISFTIGLLSLISISLYKHNKHSRTVAFSLKK